MINFTKAIYKLGGFDKLAKQKAGSKAMPTYNAWLTTNKLKDTPKAASGYKNLSINVESENKGDKLALANWQYIYDNPNSSWNLGPFKTGKARTASYNSWLTQYNANQKKKPSKPAPAKATTLEKQTLSAADLVKKYPSEFKSESDAFTSMLNPTGSGSKTPAQSAYQKYLGGAYIDSTHKGGRKDIKTLHARRDIELHRAALGSNVARELLLTWGGDKWKWLSGASGTQPIGSALTSSGGKGSVKELSLDDVTGIIDKWRLEGHEPTPEEYDWIHHMLTTLGGQEGRDMADQFADEQAAKKTMYGRYAPGANVGQDILTEAAKIKQEREGTPPHDKQTVNRYTQTSTGEVADVYDNPVDQAKFEQQVGKFREALTKLQPMVDAKQPRKRTIRKPISDLM